jgi:DNA-binding MarR family transcriptional regulator
VRDLKLLFSELIRYETELWNAIDARLRAEHDLPLSRFEPMQVIAEHDGCRIYDIVEALSITTGGASKIVDAIEASGYSRRRPNPNDRRSSVIELTPAGRRVLARATKTFEAELEQRIGAALPARSLQQFGVTLAKLRDVAQDKRDSAVA